MWTVGPEQPGQSFSDNAASAFCIAAPPAVTQLWTSLHFTEAGKHASAFDAVR